MKAETEIYKIYFRLYPTKYFLAKHKDFKRFYIMKKVWNKDWCVYMWKIVKRLWRLKL